MAATAAIILFMDYPLTRPLNRLNYRIPRAQRKYIIGRSESRRLHPMQRGFPIVLVVFLAALGGLGWAGYVLLPQYFAGATGRMVEVTVGPSRLRLDSSYLRHQEDRDGERLDGGRLGELVIAASFDSFRPAPPIGPLRPGMMQADPDLIVMTLRPADPALDPADRTAKLYARFLESDTWSNPGGLVMRRFTKGSPYASEELYIAPPEGRQFAARCMRPVQPHDGLPDTCVAETRVENLDVNIRFSPDLLVNWDRVLRGVQGLVLSMAR
ncbi:hypothetical protein PY365_21395 [Roseiarcaceae bacterium H3SJ34-1]|uniref:hypothetical protein n=1 Tax=Terripilifer ovatus TaxID=3032367 RepID=UPI003AB99A9B|nr:hypothetical protein [Roseiarcaceae bacterium H3SJ34-1]